MEVTSWTQLGIHTKRMFHWHALYYESIVNFLTPGPLHSRRSP